MSKARFLLLIVIMGFICSILEAVTFGVLYRTALNEERDRLTETVRSQASLIESIARFDSNNENAYPGDAIGAALSKIRGAHRNYEVFGQSGEFILARLEGDQIVFLLNHRHLELRNPEPVNRSASIAEPVRLALSGKSGTVIGLDYRGEKVLAAYKPVGVLNLGIVAKIDMAEIRAPFIRTAFLVTGIMIVLVLLGALLFFRVSGPLIRQIEAQNRALLEQVEERKRSEALLLQNEAFLKTLLDAIPIPVFYKDRRGKYLGANKAMEPYLGVKINQLVGKTLFDVYPQRFAENYSAIDEEVLSTGQPREYESRVKNSSDEIRNVIFNKAVFYEASGEVGGLVGTLTDITEAKIAETEFRKREQLLEETGYLANIGGWEIDPVTQTATWTKETFRILEIEESGPAPDLDKIFGYYLPEDRQKFEEAYEKATRNGEPFDLELRATTAANKKIWVRIIGYPEFKGEACVRIRGTIQDTTDSKKKRISPSKSGKHSIDKVPR